LERANFLAIFASNLDEFFMVRVAGLRRRIITGLAVPTNVGRSPSDVLADISAEAYRLQLRHAEAWRAVVQPDLSAAGIEVVTWDALGDEERVALYEYFQSQVFPVLMPLAVDPAHPFPYISGLSLNLAVRIRNARTGRQEFARLKVPPMLPRFVEVPGAASAGRGRYLPLEDLISNNLVDLFPGMEVLDHHAFRLTRNEDMTIEEDETENLIQALEAEACSTSRGSHAPTCTTRRTCRPRRWRSSRATTTSAPISSRPSARATCSCIIPTNPSRRASRRSSSRPRKTRTCSRSSRRSIAPRATARSSRH
jgi:polyphosphate kinase